ncbi:MAG: exodeoxyribonuclease V subunit gamma, partial [Clostridiales Family XIII bacterium]|nr:exodeoxyribonuclease V subunit gamma [Clostridiales Family XIII bacterium]
MLHIYFARENIDKDRFMYERIGESLARIQAAFNRVVDGGHPETGDADNRGGTGEPGGVDREPAPQRVLLVVPEQYTLQAEQDAMTAMGLPGFIDFDVLSMTSLGRRVYAGAGCRGLDFIDRYGKIMLVTKLLIDCATSLKAFGGISPSTGLASKISDMISELKNFNVSPQDLEGIAARLGDKDLLGLKLADVALIYAGFESELSGKLFDTADHLKDFARKIPQSPYIATSELWLSGYDYLSPAMKDAVIALSNKSIDTNILLTADPDDQTFSLTNGLMDDLMELARDARIPVRHIRIDDRYAKPLPPALAFLEQNLFSGNATAPPADCGEICLTLAAGFYAEAETAASRICSLVRDEGLKYRDILVLCNDMRTRVPILKRVFAEYGLPVFVDQRRAVDHDPVIEFILALPEAAAGGRAYADVFRLLKTGLTGISRDEFETLENYVLEYRIRGSLWDRDFTYGGPDPENPGFNPAYTAGEMQSLNKARGKVSALLGAFEQSFKKSRSARDRTEALRDFLTEYIGLPERIQTMAQELENAGNLEYAAELTAIEGAAFGLLDQLGVALGDIPVSAREYADCLRAGFGSLRMGMLPTGRDQIVIGTMQRTRSAAAAAVFVIGANDGVLPAATEDDGILNGDEKQRLESSGNFLGRDDDAVYYEEQLAIYRNLIKASKKLYISCSASDMDGKDLKPSPVFRRIERLLPGVAVTKDIISAEDDLARIQYPEEALAHLADHAVNAAAGRAKITAPWSDVLRWIERSPEYR